MSDIEGSIVNYTPSLIGVNGKFIETYERVSRATDDAKVELGLPSVATVKAVTGITPLEEYIVLSTGVMADGNERVFNLEAITPGIMLKSLYLGNGNFNSIRVGILDAGGNLQLEWRRNPDQTPLDFPTLVIPNNWKIWVQALGDIEQVWLIVKPAAILGFIEATDPNEIEEN